MAVTVVGSTIIMTAQGDKFSMPCTIKRIDWTRVTSSGHLLELAESSDIGDNTKVFYRDVADVNNYSHGRLLERYYPKGVEVTDMDSGQILLVYA